MKLLDVIESFDEGYCTTGLSYLRYFLSVFGVPNCEGRINIRDAIQILESSCHAVHKLSEKLAPAQKTENYIHFIHCLEQLSSLITRFSRHDLSCIIELVESHCPGGYLKVFDEELSDYSKLNSNTFLSVLDELHYDENAGKCIWTYTTFSRGDVHRHLGMCGAGAACLNSQGVSCISDASMFKTILRKEPHHELFPLLISKKGAYYNEDTKTEHPFAWKIGTTALDIPTKVI